MHARLNVTSTSIYTSRVPRTKIYKCLNTWLLSSWWLPFTRIEYVWYFSIYGHNAIIGGKERNALTMIFKYTEGSKRSLKDPTDFFWLIFPEYYYTRGSVSCPGQGLKKLYSHTSTILPIYLRVWLTHTRRVTCCRCGN